MGEGKPNMSLTPTCSFWEKDNNEMLSPHLTPRQAHWGQKTSLLPIPQAQLLTGTSNTCPLWVISNMTSFLLNPFETIKKFTRWSDCLM